MSASLRDLRLLASVAALSVLALSACTTSSPPVEQAAPAPMAQPAIPSKYRPEEVVGRWGYGAYHNDADLARTTAAARAQCGQPVVITRGPNGGVMMYLADSAELQELQLKGSRTARTISARPAMPAARRTARSSRSTAAPWCCAGSIRKSPAATAPASMCAAPPKARAPRAAGRPPMQPAPQRLDLLPRPG